MEKKDYNKTNINLFIIIFGLIIFFTKWYHPYVNFNEEIEVKIITAKEEATETCITTSTEYPRDSRTK